MSISRRDFMKLFGISAASLLLTRCKLGDVPTPFVTCYEPAIPTSLPPTPPATARERLRLLWMRFPELASTTLSGQNDDNQLGQQMLNDHRRELDELIASGELSAAVASLVTEAYTAAVYHVWRSNVPITCYEPVIVDYAPASAGVLVRQSEILAEVASQGEIDPETLANAQAALEHDLAFYALSEEDVNVLYERLMKDWQEQNQSIPSFAELDLEIPPEAQEAAQFIIDLLTGK